MVYKLENQGNLVCQNYRISKSLFSSGVLQVLFFVAEWLMQTLLVFMTIR